MSYENECTLSLIGIREIGTIVYLHTSTVILMIYF